MKRVPFVLAIFGVIGCSEFGLNEANNGLGEIDPNAAPDIEVDPTSILFDPVDVTAQESSSAVVTIRNVGQGDLHLQDILLSDSSAPYTIGALTSILIPPDGASEFTVTFEPETAGEMPASIYIDSDDPDEPTVEVTLNGEGLAPVIEVDPMEYDFGAPYIGCEDRAEIEISNVGNATLLVYSFDFSNIGAEDLTFDDGITSGANEALSWSLEPGDSRTVWVDYAPLDESQDTSYLNISSNDPYTPITQATQMGVGDIYGDHTDIYEQPINGPVDILFAVDKSCSMSDDLANVSANMDTFIGTLEGLDSDYQIALVTADDGCFNGSYNYIDNSMDESLQQQIFDEMLGGSYGTYTEAPFQLMANALNKVGSGDCNEGFYREEASLALITVSDEREQSPNDYSFYVSMFQSMKADDDEVVMHSIAGDYPSGCGGNEGGIGHYEATVATDGVFLSICASDFGSHLQSIAEGSVSENTNFALTLEPVPETIEVSIDGVQTDEGWNYVEDGNYVHFDSDNVPVAGSTLEIYYVIKPDCSEG